MHLDSVVFDTNWIKTITINRENKTLIAERPGQVPPLPDSTVKLGYLCFSIAEGAEDEMIVIDTTSIDTGTETVHYEFYHASVITTTPSFEPGAIIIGYECGGENCMTDDDADGVPAGCDNCSETYNPDQADNDSNGIGNACCCGVYDLIVPLPPIIYPFTGNTNCDIEGLRDLADIVQLIDRIYLTKELLCCEGNGNVNGDTEGLIDLVDIHRLIDHIYLTKSETAPCE